MSTGTGKKQVLFDPATFLAKAGQGKTIAAYRKGQVVFAQADVANAIFYIQKGKLKLTVISNNGKEAVVAILGSGDFFGEGCLAGQQVRMFHRSRTVRVCNCPIGESGRDPDTPR
jgi:CRP/FNR family cyclic AMP-dependent transcriptional regulator